MSFLIFLICFPLVIAGLLALIKNDQLRAFIVRGSIAVLVAVAIVTAYNFFTEGAKYFTISSEPLNYTVLGVELLISLYLLFTSLKYKKNLIALLVLIQAAAMTYYETFGAGSNHSADRLFFIDNLSIIMMLIIAVIGGLITIFAVSYMRDYQEHHTDTSDRRTQFFSLIFLFLSAMFGIIFSDHLTMLYMFWEITTLCSFLLIGYTKTNEAISNAFTALLMNVIGGVGFVGGIVYLGTKLEIVGLKDLLSYDGKAALVLLPAILLSIAAMSKAAQLPFSKWLLGAMVAPTPTSALLHSSTMVKAGVYLLIRISPILAGQISGLMVAVTGGFTFLVASFIAITEQDAKRVLAYSTIANLGLIVACAGVGGYEALWAAIMLVIFHAVSKSLMFLAVGKTEHLIGSRNIEDMHGMISKLPQMALLLAIGIAGMFLAPFGMLISKWAALVAFINSNNMLIILFLVFGSGATLLYWTKWLGKLAANDYTNETVPFKASADETLSLYTHAFFTVVLCAIFPIISSKVVEPFLKDMLHVKGEAIITGMSQYILVVILALIFILPFVIKIFKKTPDRMTSVYLSGTNQGDNVSFEGFHGNPRKSSISTWYMQDTFGESILLKPSVYIAIGILIVAFISSIGGAI